LALYDTIGLGYRELRLEDPRLAAPLHAGLEGATTIVNVGAGAGSYEPRDRELVAVELSRVMLAQRRPDAAPAIRGSATALPFDDDAFDAALAILTIHHWSDAAAGLTEMRRVARGPVVLLTWDPSFEAFWLVDYFPEILDVDRLCMPTLAMLEAHLGPLDVRGLPIPHDCTDGFLGAYWRRPHAYLDPEIRKAISTFTKIANPQPGLEALRRDLDSGEWARRYGELMERDALELGYRVVIAS